MNDSLIMDIPLLKHTKYEYSEIFSSNIQEEDDYFDEISKNYPNVILDVFSQCLDRESKEIKYLDSDYFKFVTQLSHINPNSFRV